MQKKCFLALIKYCGEPTASVSAVEHGQLINNALNANFEASYGQTQFSMRPQRARKKIDPGVRVVANVQHHSISLVHYISACYGHDSSALLD